MSGTKHSGEIEATCAHAAHVLTIYLSSKCGNKSSSAMKNTDAKQFRSLHWSLVVFRQHSKRQGVLTDREWCSNFIVCVFFTLTNWLWDRITNMLPCVHPSWLCQAVSCPYRPRTNLFLSPRKLVNRKLTAGATSKSKRPLQYKGMHCFKNIEWKQCEDMKSTFGSWLCSFFISFPCLIERNSGCKTISNETQNRNISISLRWAVLLWAVYWNIILSVPFWLEFSGDKLLNVRSSHSQKY